MLFSEFGFTGQCDQNPPKISVLDFGHSTVSQNPKRVAYWILVWLKYALTHNAQCDDKAQACLLKDVCETSIVFVVSLSRREIQGSAGRVRLLGERSEREKLGEKRRGWGGASLGGSRDKAVLGPEGGAAGCPLGGWGK